jgi:hypothetical protein
MPSAEWVNWSAACEKVVAVLCAALVRARQGVRALADGRERARRRLRAARHGIGRLLELADHGAELELQQFQDFLGRIGPGRGRHLRRRFGDSGARDDCGRLRLALSKEAECHGSLLLVEIRGGSSHPGMKSGLTTA